MNIFAGSYTDGVYLSTNYGSSWVQINEGLNNYYITFLAVNNDYVFAGEYGVGVWRRPLSELIGVQKISESVPQSYKLYQNYPNPFNPSTKISFSIPLSRGVDAEGGRGVSVRLTIYDLLGREIAILVNQNLKPGTYEVEFPAPSGNGINYPSGVYFYRLTTNDYVVTKKMILIK
jgi:hypothetical protein